MRAGCLPIDRASPDLKLPSLHSGTLLTPAVPTSQPFPDMQAAAGLCCLFSIPSLAVHIFIFSSAPQTSKAECLESVLHSTCVLFMLSCSHSFTLPFPRLGSSGSRTSAYCTNRSRIPALVDCNRSDPSCEQVQDSCIQSTLISNTPVPRTSLETWTNRPFCANQHPSK